MRTARSPWRPLDASVLHWREWGDEAVVFNSASGDTHLLDPLSARALRALIATGPATAAALAAALASEAGAECDQVFTDSVHRVLQALGDLGLIEAAGS